MADKNIIEMEMRARQWYVEPHRKSERGGQERIQGKKAIRLQSKKWERELGGLLGSE